MSCIGCENGGDRLGELHRIAISRMIRMSCIGCENGGDKLGVELNTPNSRTYCILFKNLVHRIVDS